MDCCLFLNSKAKAFRVKVSQVQCMSYLKPIKSLFKPEREIFYCGQPQQNSSSSRL